MNIPVPIHTGAVLDKPDFFTAKTEKILPVDQSMPDNIGTIENFKDWKINTMRKLDINIAVAIINWK